MNKLVISDKVKIIIGELKKRILNKQVLDYEVIIVFITLFKEEVLTKEMLPVVIMEVFDLDKEKAKSAVLIAKDLIDDNFMKNLIIEMNKNMN